MLAPGAQIFFAATRAVLEVFAVGALGVYTARAGTMDRRLARALAQFNGKYFLPALLWTSLSRSVTAERLREMWLLPLACVVHVMIGLALGLGVVRACGVAPGFRTVTTMSAAFGNSLALPVVVTRAITRNPRIGNLTFTKEDGDRCVLYLSVYVVVLSASMWSVGPWLFRRRIAARVSGGMESRASESDFTRIDTRVDDGERGEEPSSAPTRSPSFSKRTLDFTRAFLNPNVASCIAGVVTGIATPVRDIIFQPGRALSWVGGAAQILADAAIPTVLLVIGSSLARGPDYTLADKRTSLAIVGVRFVVIPMITIGVYYALRDAKGIAPDDKIFWLVFLCLGTTPTANNMMLQAQMFHPDDRAAAGVGTLLFWQYLTIPVFLTAYVSWYLAIIDR